MDPAASRAVTRDPTQSRTQARTEDSAQAATQAPTWKGRLYGLYAYLIARGSLRFRFLALTVPRLLFRRESPRELRAFAEALEAAGHLRFAIWCRRRLLRANPRSRREFDALLELYLRVGDHTRAVGLLRWFERRNGLIPDRAIKVVGELALAGRERAAGALLSDLIGEHGTGLADRSPSSMQSPLEVDWRAGALEQGGVAASRVELARLCFAFRAWRPAVGLFSAAADHQDLTSMDRAALAYATWRAGGDLQPMAYLQARTNEAESPIQAGERLFMEASIAYALGDDRAYELAHEAVSRIQHEHAEVDQIVEECARAARALLGLRDGIQVADATGSPGRQHQAGIPKLFLCGFGWSGSGAVYDAIRGDERLCEFPGVRPDPIIPDDATSEMTFIQSPSGLGRIWQEARRDGIVSGESLWDLFRLHVAGGCYAGYPEYKSVNAARHQLAYFGVDYVSIFRDFFERLGDGFLDVDELRGLLEKTTEALCVMLAGRTGGQYVLFNNAVFGRDPDILDIFSNIRAIAVERDPRDVYADRKRNDPNHWRTPEQFLAFYQSGLRRYREYVDNGGRHAHRMRLVSFERFVRDADYRDEVIRWALDGESSPSASEAFRPEQSQQNIGIHVDVLEPEEARVFCEHMSEGDDDPERKGSGTAMRSRS